MNEQVRLLQAESGVSWRMIHRFLRVAPCNYLLTHTFYGFQTFPLV